MTSSLSYKTSKTCRVHSSSDCIVTSLLSFSIVVVVVSISFIVCTNFCCIFKIIMSTWQQHTLSNTTTNTITPTTQNHSITNRAVSVDIPDSLGDINHTSALSGDFGRYSIDCVTLQHLCHVRTRL
jgi:hypothetical protein